MAKVPTAPHSQGIRSLARSLVKYERWTELLDTRTIPWREIPADKLLKAYVQARAHFALGHREEAEKAMEALEKLAKDKSVERIYAIMSLDLKARLAFAKGETLLGLGLLSDAAEKQYESPKRRQRSAPLSGVLFNSLGHAYLKAGAKDLAIQAFEKALTLTRNDRFALLGLEKAGKPPPPNMSPRSANTTPSGWPRLAPITGPRSKPPHSRASISPAAATPSWSSTWAANVRTA